MPGVIYWNGQPVPFRRGETLAAALLRANVYDRGQPGSNWRVFCGIGTCQQCTVLIEGRSPAEVCLTLAEDGMRLSPLPVPTVEAQGA